jgi:hypothetical protein
MSTVVDDSSGANEVRAVSTKGGDHGSMPRADERVGRATLRLLRAVVNERRLPTELWDTAVTAARPRGHRRGQDDHGAFGFQVGHRRAEDGLGWELRPIWRGFEDAQESQQWRELGDTLKGPAECGAALHGGCGAAARPRRQRASRCGQAL